MLLYGQDVQVCAWVCQQLKMKPYPEGTYRAIGIIHEDRIIGGVVWNNYHEDNSGKPLLIEVTLATIDKRWATRHNLRELFQYPYLQLGVKRVQATTSRKAKRVRTTLIRLGFKFEGIVREAHPLGGDAAHYSMLKSECFWITHGKISAVSTSSTRPENNGGCSNKEQPANCAL